MRYVKTLHVIFQIAIYDTQKYATGTGNIKSVSLLSIVLIIHVESNMENLVKEKEKMSEYIVNNDKAFKVIDDKVTENQEKILQLEAKFDKVKIIENQINNKDVFIQDLQKRVKIMEISLTEKDEHINNLLERMNFMEEKFKLLENEKHEVSEMEKTFFNPSDVQKQCEQCDYETSSSKG